MYREGLQPKRAIKQKGRRFKSAFSKQLKKSLNFLKLYDYIYGAITTKLL